MADKDRGGTALGALVAAGVLIIAMAVQYNACETATDDALSALRAAGLQHVELGGIKLGACADNESSRHFAATNHLGAPVSGTVCCGMVAKGCTIRWD